MSAAVGSGCGWLGACQGHVSADSSRAEANRGLKLSSAAARGGLSTQVPGSKKMTDGTSQFSPAYAGSVPQGLAPQRLKPMAAAEAVQEGHKPKADKEFGNCCAQAR